MKDLFSKQASTYAQFRPRYPDSVYDFVLQNVEGRNLAWDCATGNGQAAQVLCQHFERVMATDISQNQLDNAFQADNILYSKQAAEKTDFPDQAFDLVTVAQALHWFDFVPFFEEVRRVTKPGGLFVTWGYELCQFDTDALDNAFQNFYYHETKDFWSPERRHIENQYAEVPFPFEMIHAPDQHMVFKWHLHEFEGYLNSWSAVQKCIKTRGYNPVDQFIMEITPYWGEFSRQDVHFPIFIRAGRC
jgi:SAM-dependent methyltransferase